MTHSTEILRLLLRASYYLAILAAIMTVASHRLSQHPAFVYQGF